MRLLWIFLLLGVLLSIPFLVWGEAWEEAFSTQGAVAWLREQGQWAWAFALALLIADLLLPLPSTAIMSGLGIVYGPVVGGVIGAGGSILSGLLAYSLCRSFGRGLAERIAGKADLERGEVVFRTVGGWVVVFSRWLPLLPEVVSCMAGLSRMPLKQFVLALICGSVPMAFTFAIVGAQGIDRPALALILSALVPLLLWPFAQWFLRRTLSTEKEPREDSSQGA